MHIHKFIKGLIMAPLLLLLTAAEEAPQEQTWLSSNASFQVSYRSEVEPIPLNQMHQWTLLVETPGGEPVADAQIQISGGMPAHDHGMPTSPQTAGYLGDGLYRVEGMRFHMMGAWEVTLFITRGNVTETVVIPLRI